VAKENSKLTQTAPIPKQLSMYIHPNTSENNPTKNKTREQSQQQSNNFLDLKNMMNPRKDGLHA